MNAYVLSASVASDAVARFDSLICDPSDRAIVSVAVGQFNESHRS